MILVPDIDPAVPSGESSGKVNKKISSSCMVSVGRVLSLLNSLRFYQLL